MILIFTDEGCFEQAVTMAPKGYEARLDALGRKWAKVKEKPAVPLHHLHLADGAVRAREALPAELSPKGRVLKNLPDPCTVLIDGVPHEVTGGRLDLFFGDPGTYRIEIDHWPYLPWAREVIL